MSCILFKTDGSIATFDIKSKTLVESGEYFRDNFCESGEVDLCDIYTKTLENGDVEYITCIYDSGGGVGKNPDKVNKHFPSDYICYGDIMVVKTKKSPSSYFVDDVLQNILQEFSTFEDLDVVLGMIQSCGEKARSISLIYPIGLQKQVFPCVRQVDGSEIDLLTMELKTRSFILRKYLVEGFMVFAMGLGNDQELVESKKKEIEAKYAMEAVPKVPKVPKKKSNKKKSKRNNK